MTDKRMMPTSHPSHAMATVSVAVKPTPILFEAALPHTGTAFTLDAEGEATLKLCVPEQFAKVLSDNIHRLRGVSFIVRIDGAE